MLTVYSDELTEGMATIIITDMKGKRMYEDKLFITAAGYGERVDMSALGDGVFVLTAYQDERVLNTKFILIH
jgi:hypothetical protein